MAWYATVRQTQRQPLDAIDWAERAIEEAKRANLGPSEAEGVSWYILDWAHVTLGRADEAVFAERALEIYEQTGNLERVGHVLNHLAIRAYLEGRWSDFLPLANRAREASDRIGDAWTAAVVLFNIGEVLADQGRNAEAEPNVREALRTWQDAASPDAAEAMSLLGRVLTNRGELEEARALLDESIKVFRESGDEAEELRAHARVAEWLLASGDAHGALTLATETLERTASGEGLSALTVGLHRIRGQALAATGEADAARAALAQSIEAAHHDDANYLMTSAEYEIGRTYGALASLAESAGEDPSKYIAERNRILLPLGVVD
jgi:tetratricopeptide (TPR) repeat protein